MKNIVFVGAGGTGMSWLAMLLFDLGYKNIICINNITTALTDRLEAHGLKVILWHGVYQVQRDDIVIYSDIQAIVDGPEITQSRLYQQTPTKKHFHICLTYNEFIAEISKRFITVSVAGSNGKTSTTAMLIWSLFQSENKFWLGIVGGLMPNFDQQWYAISQDADIQSDIFHLFEHIFNQKHQLNYSLLKKYIFVIEACEHREHFLLYDSDYTLITNIERDHVDYYKTPESYQQAFQDMMTQTRKNVILTPSSRDALRMVTLPENVMISESFEINNSLLVGTYISSNASMVNTLFHLLKSNNQQLITSLQSFEWVGRRMEMIGKIEEKILYSDYGHHAPALVGNIAALKQQFPDKKVCAIFQPHQAQRVLAGWNDFQQALEWADITIIYRLYTARENFSDLQNQYPRLRELSDFNALGRQFAQDLNADYVTEISSLVQQLHTLSEDYVIVYFSAWDLDEEMRSIID